MVKFKWERYEKPCSPCYLCNPQRLSPGSSWPQSLNDWKTKKFRTELWSSNKLSCTQTISHSFNWEAYFLPTTPLDRFDMTVSADSPAQNRWNSSQELRACRKINKPLRFSTASHECLRKSKATIIFLWQPLTVNGSLVKTNFWIKSRLSGVEIYRTAKTMLKSSCPAQPLGAGGLPIQKPGSGLRYWLFGCWSLRVGALGCWMWTRE